MAEWCVVCRQPPSVYKELARDEREAFYEAAKRVYGLK